MPEDDTLGIITETSPEVLAKFDKAYVEPEITWNKGTRSYVCGRCGAMIQEAGTHRRWHKNFSLGVWLGLNGMSMLLEKFKEAGLINGE